MMYRQQPTEACKRKETILYVCAGDRIIETECYLRPSSAPVLALAAVTAESTVSLQSPPSHPVAEQLNLKPSNSTSHTPGMLLRNNMRASQSHAYIEARACATRNHALRHTECPDSGGRQVLPSPRNLCRAQLPLQSGACPPQQPLTGSTKQSPPSKFRAEQL